ncbi:hypothetical protein [Mammaliicoccus lentus]|uniref:hypothetical protein n=1 Tax=Mammaliicoccus lentus TaxID=42858 RepID=UPI0031F40D46
MNQFHFKENFFGSSTKPIDVFNQYEEPVYKLSLYYTSTHQETFAILGRKNIILSLNFKVEIILYSKRKV